MTNLGWREAIIQVLQQNAEPMHYTEIAEAIVEQGLRANVGATPARTVSATITNSLKDELERSPFVRVGTGYYSLKESAQAAPQVLPIEAERDADNTGLINAFGMYWARDNVLWRFDRAFLASSNWAARLWISATRTASICCTMVAQWFMSDGQPSSL